MKVFWTVENGAWVQVLQVSQHEKALFEFSVALQRAIAEAKKQ